MNRLHRIRKVIMAMVFACMLFLAYPGMTVRADEAIKAPEEFEKGKLEGDAKYLDEEYRDNYIFDIEETSIVHFNYLMINGIANVLFAAIRTISFATVTLFYWAIKFDVGELFGGQINGIQQALKDTVFEPLLLLACAACMAAVAVKLLKRDTVGGLTEMAKIVLVVALSTFVVLKSDAALSFATNITKEVSLDALAGVNDSGGLSGDVDDFAAQAAGVLWVDLVHEPWKTVEFMHERVDDGTVEAFLSTGDADQRAELVEDMEGSKCFKMTVGFERLGFLMIYLIPCLAKCLLFMIVAGVLMLFQVLAVFYLILAPVMLLLFLFAGYERILTAWLKKILETQVMILVVTFMLALLIRTDVFLFEKADEWGWFIVLLAQIIIGAGLFLNRGRIIELLSAVQRGTATPRYAVNRMRMGGNISTMQKNAAASGKRIGQQTALLRGKIGAAAKTAGMATGMSSGGQTGQNAAKKPVYQPPTAGGQPKGGAGGKNNLVMAAAAVHPGLAPAAKALQTKTLQAGTQAKAYVKSGRLGRDVGRAAGAAADAVPRLKDSLGMAGERLRSAPVQFRYAVHTGNEKAREAAAGMAETAREKATAARTAVINEAGRMKQDASAVIGSNAAGYRQGYQEKEKRRQDRSEKRAAYRESVGARRSQLNQAAEKRRAIRYVETGKKEE